MVTPLGDGLLRNGSVILGKRLTSVAALPLIVLAVTVTLLLPTMDIPPPCRGADARLRAPGESSGGGRGRRTRPALALLAVSG
eukprot:31752-Prymnesium_polylepis.1